MATVLMAVDGVYVQAAYAVNDVYTEFMASCHRHPWCQCTPCSHCQANALPFEDTVACWQCFNMWTSECESKLLAAYYNAAGLVLDDWAIAVTCGIPSTIVISLGHPLHIVPCLCARVWNVHNLVFVVGTE